jgi:lipid-A-disaccharide synthase
VHQIARLVNAMAVVFPFEVPFYKRARVPVQFVGHPLRDTAASELSRDEAVRSFGLDPTRLVVGLFPGSRRGEVARLFPLILETGRLLRQQFPAAQFLLPRASSLTPEDLAPHLAAAGLPVVVVDERVYDVIRACDAIVTVSGTVTLEIALVGTPMVIIYRVSPLTYAIGKRVVKVDHIGLCNIVAGARVVPELIQDAAQPAAIAREVARFLTDPAAAGEVRSQLATVRQRLGEGGAAARVARLALDLLAAKA